MANETSLGGISWYVDADTSKAVNSVKSFDTVVDSATGSLKTLDTRATKTATSIKSAMSGMGKSAGAAGIQVQQFVGQIQGGQNAMLALSQQAADLGIVLGAPMVGVIVALGASLAGMLLPSLFDSKDATEDLTEKMRELNEVYDLTPAQIAVLISEQEKLIKSYKESNVEIAKEIKLLKQKAEQSGVAKDSILGQVGAAARQKAMYGDIETETNKLNAQIDTNNQLIQESEGKINELNETGGKAKKVQEEIATAVKKHKNELDALSTALSVQIATFGMSERQVAHYKATLMGASTAMHDQIDVLYDKKEAHEAAERALKAEAAQQKENARAYTQDQANANKMIQLRNQYLADARTDDQAGADTMMTLRTEYIDEGRDEAQDIVGNDSEEAARQAQIEKLQNLRELDIENEQLYQDAITKLQEEGAAARQQAITTSMGTLSSAFGSMAQTISDAGNESSDAYKALFAVSKAFAIAQAGLNLSLAVSQAMAAAPWPANLAAMAQVAASGAALVSSISSASYAGREHGGSVQAGQTYEVGEKNKPEMLMIPGNNGKVFSNAEMKSMMGGGGSGSSAPVIHNYAARDGYQVEYQRGGMGQQDVIKIVTSEMKNRSSKSRQALGRTSNTTNKVGSRR